MNLSYMTLHLSHSPVYTEGYRDIKETDSLEKQKHKSKQKRKWKKCQFIFQIFMSRYKILTHCGLILQF